MKRLSMILKRIRVEHDELLIDMAKRLRVSSAFLSAVENGRKSAPAAWTEILSCEYALSDDYRLELAEAIDGSVKHVRMDLSAADEKQRSCALAFARNFDDFSDEDIQKIMSIINKKED